MWRFPFSVSFRPICGGICSLLSSFSRKNETKERRGGLLLVAECWEQCLWPCLASRAAVSSPLARPRSAPTSLSAARFPARAAFARRPYPRLHPACAFCLSHLLAVALPPGCSPELYRSAPTVLGSKNYAWLPCWYCIWVLFWEIGKIWILPILRFYLLLIRCSVFSCMLLFFNPLVSSYVLSSSPKSVFRFHFPLIKVYFFPPWTKAL